MEVKTKSRAQGYTTLTHQVEAEPAEEKQADPEQLKRWLEHFAKQFKNAATDKARCEDIMRRQGTKKWSPEKTQKMVRRLVTANKTMEQAESVLDQCTHRLSQLGIEVSIESKSSQNVE